MAPTPNPTPLLLLRAGSISFSSKFENGPRAPAPSPSPAAHFARFLQHNSRKLHSRLRVLAGEIAVATRMPQRLDADSSRTKDSAAPSCDWSVSWRRRSTACFQCWQVFART
ncbi:hypothetical protein Zmor_027809 [Zophobas morio]|uniref:Uncharacterized protein n=1 Tax=Zophobas morio TaxID=2755281 RepID=A0AA38HRD3_9CUCU|nr:hypothetical protein Zmor_027809 [Zophobas morio]